MALQIEISTAKIQETACLVGEETPPFYSMPPRTVRQAGQHSTQLRYVTSRPEPKAVVTAEATTEAAHSFATEAAVGCSIQTSRMHDLD